MTKCKCNNTKIAETHSKIKLKLKKKNIYILISAVKRLIVINHIQNKSFGLHNVCTVYIYYVYINIHTCMYIFKKNMLHLYIKYI